MFRDHAEGGLTETQRDLADARLLALLGAERDFAVARAKHLRRIAAIKATTHAPPPRQQELMAKGLSRYEALQFCSLEIALDVARLELPEYVERVAHVAALALMWPEVRREAVARLSGPRHSATWRLLAASLPPDERGPFDELADSA